MKNKLTILLFICLPILYFVSSGQDNNNTKYRANPNLAKEEAEVSFQKGAYLHTIKLCRLYYNLTGETTIQKLQAKASQCNNLIDIGNKFFENKEYTQALQKYNELLGMNPTDSYAQHKIEEITDIIKPQSEKKPKTSVSSSKGVVTPDINIKLVGEQNGERVEFTKSQWKKIAPREKAKIHTLWVKITVNGASFILAKEDLSPHNGKGGMVDWNTAMLLSGGQLPTKAQGQILKRYRSTINEALLSFDGFPLPYSCIWNQGETANWTVFNYTENMSNPNEDIASIRLVSDDCANGFSEVIINKPDDVDYDYIGPYSNGLALVEYKYKYGYINENKEIVVPLKYDDIGYKRGKLSDEIHSTGVWRGMLKSVEQNGKWGYINKNGETIIPHIYDVVTDHISDSEDVASVSTNYYHDGKPLFALISADGSYITDFKYRYMEEPSEGLISVRYEDGTYGYINYSGKEIGGRYSYTDKLSCGRGLVVKDNKVGYVNNKGELVIPCQFGMTDKKGTNYSNSYFHFFGSTAFVTNNLYFAMIDTTGKQLTPFKYDGFESGKYGGEIDAKLNGTIVYLDKLGNEYATEVLRDSLATFKYAENNDAEAELDLGRNYLGCSNAYYATHLSTGEFKLYSVNKDINKAKYWLERAVEHGNTEAMRFMAYRYRDGDLELKDGENKSKLIFEYFAKAAELGDRYAQREIAKIYYYQNEPISNMNLSDAFSNAFLWFQKAAEQNDNDSAYFLGWMYEKGQYVKKDIEKAIEWYTKSKGARDSAQRIEQLTRQNRNK